MVIELHPALSTQDVDNLRAGQRKMTLMLEQFDKICRKYNLSYWLNGGTLIGAVRHKGWVPWDGDVDVCMINTDYEKFRKVANNELPSSMWLQDKTTDVLFNKRLLCKIRDIYSSYLHYDKKHNINYYVDNSIHTGLQLDIFVYYDVFKNNKRELVLSFTGHWVSKYKDLSDFDYSVIYPLREIEFEGIKVYVPNKLEEFCVFCYGSYPPSLPPVEQRFPHEGLIQPFEALPEIMEKYKELYSSRKL
jgi:lipopolysaccharide cholinephosphotransferase